MRSRNCLFLVGTFMHLVSFDGVCVAHLLRFLCCVFCFVCLCSMYYAQCCLCLRVVHSWLRLRFTYDLNVLTLNSVIKENITIFVKQSLNGMVNSTWDVENLHVQNDHDHMLLGFIFSYTMNSSNGSEVD